MYYTVKGTNEYKVMVTFNFDLLDGFINRKTFFIIDSNVNVDIVSHKFNAFYSYSLNAKEENKSLATYTEIISLLTKYAFNKSDLIIAIGGGITLDLAGFIASTFKRGIELILIPTTLLSIVDASIGSKNALNYYEYKNVIGSFYDPSMVIINPSFLSTLDEDEFNNGLIEAIKMGLVKEPKILDALKNNDINEVINLCVKAKCEVVNSDYFDKGYRHILNFGHTIAHAMELLNPNFRHGFSVGAGMLFFTLNQEKKKSLYDLLCNIYNVNEYIEFVMVNRYDVLDAINQDKKVRFDKVDCVLLDEDVQIKSLTLEEIDEIIRSFKING